MSRILIVEDSQALALTYQKYLAGAGHDSDIAGDKAAARALLQGKNYAAALLDMRLPDGSGLDLLPLTPPSIILTADGGVDTAVQAIHAGAEDYICKPVTPERLLLTLSNLLEKHALKNTVASYRARDREHFCGFTGASPAMQAVYRIIENAAASKAPVFITGESGTGKELAARAIHDLSPRRAHAFEALNCAAIPATMIESEMFGHVKGAFTGATAASDGAAARAHGGTLFLDELSEMPAELQSKLLRFTQTGAFRPLGGQREGVSDARFVSATNRDPLEAVREGRLREDLYYRLNVIPVALPPLRARGEDAALIAATFLKQYTAEEKKHFAGMTIGAHDLILSHPWPGNVRQLENAVRRAVILNDGEVLTAEMLADEEAPSRPAGASLESAERALIEQTISRCQGNILRAARELKINPSTIHRKLKRWRSGA